MADRPLRFSTQNTFEPSHQHLSQSRRRRSTTGSRKEHSQYENQEQDNWNFFNHEIKRCRDILSRLRARSPVASTSETRALQLEPRFESVNRSPMLETSDRGRYFNPPMRHPDNYYESSLKKKYLTENDWTSPRNNSSIKRTGAISNTSGKKPQQRHSSARTRTRHNDFLYDDYKREDDDDANKSRESIDDKYEDIQSERLWSHNKSFNKIDNITQGRPYRNAILREKSPREELSPTYMTIKSNAEKNRDFFTSELERLKQERNRILQENLPVQQSFDNTFSKTEYPANKLNFRPSAKDQKFYSLKSISPARRNKQNKTEKRQSSKSKTRRTAQQIRDSKYKAKRPNSKGIFSRTSHEGTQHRVFRDFPSKPIYPVQKTNLLYMGLPTTYAREDKYLFRF